MLVEFQKVQRVSAEKQREFVDRARLTNVRNDYEYVLSHLCVSEDLRSLYIGMSV